MNIYGAETIEAALFDEQARHYDAVMLMSFGGPEGMEDVLPFLENVTRGRNIPRERLLEVSHHYERFGGVSPINEQNRQLIAALEKDLEANGLHLPIYFGNRNWHPFVSDTLRQMVGDGVENVLVFVTSAFSSYSACRQYREDIIQAAESVKDAPRLDKIRLFYNHPDFITANAENLRKGLNQFPAERQEHLHIAFTAHSIPLAMAKASDYEAQLQEACRLVAEQVGIANYKLVYQSRSGAPHIPWLEPDILNYMEWLAAQGVTDLIIHPIGFISDHMEVLYDLDTEAVEKAGELGITLLRSATVGTHRAFVSMIRELIIERMTENPSRKAIGVVGASHDNCPLGCCLKG